MKFKTAQRIQGISEYYFSKKLKEIRLLIDKGIDVINLGIGSPDMLPPKGVVKKMQEASQLSNANVYQNSTGIEALRKKWSEWYKRNYYVSLKPSEIFPLMGSKEGIMHISMAYLEKSDIVLIPDPGYPPYSSVSHLVGAEVLYYSLTKENQWIVDLQSLKSKDLSRVKIMWINYPHMPTGATISLEKLEEIVDFVQEKKILLVHDNPYSFILNESPLSIFQVKGAKEIAFELNSLSKTYNMSGWRLGMLAGKKEHIDNIIKVKSQMDSGIYLPLQIGAIKAMSHSKEWFTYLNIEYRKRRNIIWSICDKLKLHYETQSSGLFVWAKLPAQEDDKSWSDYLFYKKRVFITPGSLFGKEGKGYVRFSLCCPRQILKKAKIKLLS